MACRGHCTGAQRARRSLAQRCSRAHRPPPHPLHTPSTPPPHRGCGWMRGTAAVRMSVSSTRPQAGKTQGGVGRK
eukprot:208281-Prorocentrum_minimum.AAC.3